MNVTATMTPKLRKFYIGGAWVEPIGQARLEVVNPATERPIAEMAMGSPVDVDRAVAAAKRAFPSFSRTTREERIDLFKRIHAAYMRRYDELANAVTTEIGSPVSLGLQALAGHLHLQEMIRVLETFPFEMPRGSTMVVREPVGVVAAIIPWNWPLNQLVCKVAPALAAGCTMVLKPSEIAPLSASLFAEVMDEAGTPPGVFNMVQGDGATVGRALAAHPDVEMVSITGSTRAGIDVAKAAADTVKRVHQELGGKSANIILDDVDLEQAVSAGVMGCFLNSGQTCNAPTRMLVPEKFHDQAAEIAGRVAVAVKVGDPRDPTTVLGPLAGRAQFEKVQELIQSGISEGARLVAGGPGRPGGFPLGYFVRPTVFSNVKPGMRIEREEIFGPVLSILSYRNEQEAVEIANDTPYGLAGYVASKNMDRARAIATQLRAGNVWLNHPMPDPSAPFGGYKQSGNGKEYGEWGLDEFLETKAVLGYQAA